MLFNSFFFCPMNCYTKNLDFMAEKVGRGISSKLHQSSGIRNRAMMLLCRDFLDACRKKTHHDLVFGRFENSICQTDDIRMILIVQCFSIHLCLFARKKTLIVSQTDENNCLPNPCHNGGKCIDGINDYTCECVAGYLGKNCSVGECVGVNPSLTYPF